jgi:tetratricopeptide (TPR) repeat protein
MRRRNRFPALGDVQQIMAGRYHQREAARATETDIMPSSSKRPDDPNELAREGAACWQAREFDKAISHYTAALQLAPNCTALLSRRADAHAHKGDFKRAIADIDSALHIDRCDSSLYVQKLNLLAYNAELTGAVLDVSVLSGNLDSAGAHLFLAIQLFYEKSVQESMSSCNDAVRLDRTFAAGYAWRGYVYAVLGEKGPAERDWAEAIRLGSPPSGHGFLSALPYFGLAHYLYSDGRYLEAVIYSDHAIRLY